MDERTEGKKTAGNLRYVAMLTLWLFGTGLAAFVGLPPQTMEAQRLSQIANEFRSRLGLSAKIEVSIVKENQRLASVRPLASESSTYLLEIDRPFLSTLSEQEKRAIIAHELGHVWIFTHHPYLQTEPLANDMAAKLVPKESLVKVYQKVWVLDGQPGTLTSYLTHRMAIPTLVESSDAAVPALLPQQTDQQSGH